MCCCHRTWPTDREVLRGTRRTSSRTHLCCQDPGNREPLATHPSRPPDLNSVLDVRFTKHVLPVIRTEGSAIFPLGVTNFVSMMDRNPSAFENGLSIANERLLKPGNHLACFVFAVTVFDIVIRESDVERILARNEVDRDKISARTRVRVIVPSIAVIPVFVQELRSLGTGLLPLGRWPIQKIVVIMPSLQGYRPGPPLKAAPGPINEGPVK